MRGHGRLCPVWVGYLLASPLRRLGEKPEKILGPYVRPGMKVLDFGSAMGFFSLPVARMVGEGGRVLCADVQPRMLERLRKRAEKSGLGSRIETVVCPPDGLGAIADAGPFELVLTIHVLHEVLDLPATLRALAGVLAPNGLWILIEPRGHVNERAFAAELEEAARAGLRVRGPLAHSSGRAAVLERGQVLGLTSV